MSVELTDQQNDLIATVARNNGFSDYEVIANPGSVKGDNFLGILTTLTVQNDRKKLELILKSAHQNEAFRKAAPLRNAYLREIYIYEVIFKEFKKFQEDYEITDVFNSYPKLYKSSTEEGHECFIMENLKTTGYQLWEKKIPMNPGHVRAVLKEYAKFHAISLAMNEKNPELFAQLTKPVEKNIFDTSEFVQNAEKMEMYIDATFRNGFEAVKDEPELLECLQKVRSIISEIFMKTIKKPKYKIAVIHGDGWCNNFLFKYKDSDVLKPTNMMIVDWQISNLSSPAQDFCYFFLVHCDKEMFANYKEYLHLYYDTLADQLRKFKCDPDEIFPLSEFEDHLKVFMVFGLHMSLMILKIMICDSAEAPDLNELTEGNDMMEMMSFKLKNVKVYNERLKIVMEFLKNNKFI